MGKEKEELRASDSQLKWYTNHLKFSMSAMKKTLISFSNRTETAENRTGVSSCEWLNYTQNAGYLLLK